MARRERRASALAERKRRKKGLGQPGTEDWAWMAALLPADGGTVLEVGGRVDGTLALEKRGWRAAAVDANAVLAQGTFGGEAVDAVTCWLLDPPLGSGAAAEKLRAMGLRTTDEARLALQTLVYRLADRVLRDGGVLQVVDRFPEALDEARSTGILRLQRAQARGTSLEFASMDARRPHGGGVLVSVRSRKT
jgi:hypothetical protein